MTPRLLNPVIRANHLHTGAIRHHTPAANAAIPEKDQRHLAREGAVLSQAKGAGHCLPARPKNW